LARTAFPPGASRKSEVAQIFTDKPFDAALGRFILQFLPEPAGRFALARVAIAGAWSCIRIL